jgi:hypothetical protein
MPAVRAAADLTAAVEARPGHSQNAASENLLLVVSSTS